MPDYKKLQKKINKEKALTENKSRFHSSSAAIIKCKYDINTHNL